MHVKFRLLAAAVLLVTASLLQAQQKTALAGNRYRWTDAHGVVQYADSPTADALQAGYDVIDSRGNVVQHVDRVKTAAEKKADADAAAATAHEQQRTAQIEQNNRQMLAAYPTEQTLIDSQQKGLLAIDQQLTNIKISQADQEKSLAEQLAYASTFEREGKAVPVPVKQQIDTLRANVESQQKAVAKKEAERAAQEQKNASDLAHYRELRAAEAKPDAQ